jgi:parallel beta-helix repeat protein
MKRNCLLLFLVYFVLGFLLQAQPLEVWVDDDFTSATPGWGVTHFNRIHDGINAVAEGGTVHVASGTYTEDPYVDVYKPVTLLGEGRDVVTVKVTEAWRGVFYVHAANVTITGFTVVSASGRGVGIWLYQASNCTVKDNAASSIDHGVYVEFSHNNTIDNNVFDSMTTSGISLYYDSNDNALTNNYITRSGFGISLQDSSNNLIKNNIIPNSNWRGIALAAGSNNVVEGNTVESTWLGISLEYSSNNMIKNNTCNSNNVGIYAYREYGDVIENNTANSNRKRDTSYGKGIEIVECNEVVVRSNTVKSNEFVGISLYKTANGLVERNTAESNWIGIYLGRASNNVVRNNFANFNDQGIYLLGESNDVIENNSVYANRKGIYPHECNEIVIRNNIAKSNEYAGIHVYKTPNSLIEGNKVESNWLGIYLGAANNNIVKNNTANANDQGIYLIWESKDIIRQNTCNSNRIGIYLVGSSEITLENNTCDSNGMGIFVIVSNNNVIRYSNITNNKSYGIRMDENCQNNIAQFNNILNNAYGVANSPDSSVLHARYNWWGSVDGPEDPVGTSEVLPCAPVADMKNTEAPISGVLGNRVSENVNYCPWLNAPYPGGVPVSGLPKPNRVIRYNFEGYAGRLENNDTLVLIVRDKTDERNIATSALKIIDTNAKITVTPNPVSYSCGNCSNITVRIEDPDENLSPNYIESVPFFVIVNPGSWNPQNSGVNDFCSLLRRGGYNPSAGADLNQPIRWYNIYDEPVAGGPGWPSSLFSRWIQYPASWLEGGRVVGRALFFANETERNSGVFEYNFGRLEDLQRALGFARFPAGTTISFYYIDPNDFDDMDLAVIWVGNRPHSEVYLTDSGGIPVSEVRLGLGYEGLYVKVYDADANVEACCPDKVVVHICDPHNEDDSEYWVIDEAGANSGVFSSQSGMPLLPVWDAVGGYQLVFDDWKVQAFNEDTVFVRYNSVAYLEDDLNRLGDGNPNDGHFPPRINESTRNQCWDVSFAKAKVYDFQVFDGGTNHMRFLDGNYQPVTEIPISGSLYLEVTDLDQNEHPGLRELIFGGWNKDAFGPQDSRPLWPGELETFLGLRGFSITGIPKTVKIFMFNAQRGTWERMDLRETGLSTGIFRSTTCVLVADSRNPGEGNLGSRPGDTIMAFYQDPSNHSDISIIQIKVSEGGAGGVTPPTAALSVAFDKATYYPGDTVTITVTDEQYSGAVEIVGPNILVLLDNDGGLITSWDKLKAVAGQPGRFQVNYVLPETVKLGTITAKYTDPSMPTRTAQAQATVTKAFEKVTGITVTPNPFKTLTAFVIQGEPVGAVASKIRITIYDLTGARVAELSGTNTASVTWDGGNLRNGAYIYVAQVESAGKVFGRFKGFVYIER